MTEEIEQYINELNEQLKNDSSFKNISISCTFKDNKVAFRCDFTDMYEYRDKVSIAIKMEGFEETKNALDLWIQHVTLGVKAIRELNDIIKEHQKEKSCNIRIIYKFSYCNEDTVKIVDWDYNKIVVGLNKKTISNLVSYYNNVGSIINLDDYNCTLVEFLGKFNSAKLHYVIGAELVGDAVSILKGNMLTREEILNMIENKSINTGTQKIKSVFSIGELGIIAIFIWNIDFDIGIIGTTLMENKMLNIKEDRFIRDSSICNAVHSMYEIKANEINSIFDII